MHRMHFELSTKVSYGFAISSPKKLLSYKSGENFEVRHVFGWWKSKFYCKYLDLDNNNLDNNN